MDGVSPCFYQSNNKRKKKIDKNKYKRKKSCLSEFKSHSCHVAVTCVVRDRQDFLNREKEGT